MKRFFFNIVFCYSVLFCSAQAITTEYFFPVLAKCTNYERQYLLNIYDWHLEDPSVVYPNLTLSNALFWQDETPLVATIKDDNTITITSSEYTEEGDYNGTGIITKDYLSLDYTISWDSQVYETCHMESIPYICIGFSFGSGKIWSYLTKDKTNNIIGTTQYKYKTNNDGPVEMPIQLDDIYINNHTYLILQSSNDCGTSWSDIGYIRVEASAKKIYFLKKGEKNEKLLYDFTLKIGDTFNGKKVLDIDTIDIGLSKRPRFIFSDDVWIKDLGSLYYPYFDKPIVSDSQQLLTSIRYDPELYPQTFDSETYLQYLWKDSKYEDCYYERTAINNTVNPQISLSPNPVKDKLTLTLPNAENEINIYDLQGKLMLQQNVGFSAEINVSMLPTGTYVLVVNGESYKFVKE
ncbi:MAG: T9SS type A sorting domain-containing protein [Bacteroidales bacterium]|nr:T9SS type A sorting domain-containing protein [Bacteroidales bacterium]